MRKLGAMILLFGIEAGCNPGIKGPVATWRLAEESRTLVTDEMLIGQIYRALDAAAQAGTDPSISQYPVRAATVVESGGQEHVIVGGNTEYQVPEAIHGETSLLNHVTALLGRDATRGVRFVAFYTDGQCGQSLSCGDCRDYQIAATDWENLLVVCGQGSDKTVRVRRFSDAVVPEDEFPEVEAADISLSEVELRRLVEAAQEARHGGVRLFTSASRHRGAAALSSGGNVYRAAGVDDAAFHYRYPVGGVLQQAASESDYFLRAIVVVGEPQGWPTVSYRERQYGNEFSRFNRLNDMEPIQLILTDGQGAYRMTTFEEALPHAFSTDNFMPGRLEEFLRQHAKEGIR